MSNWAAAHIRALQSGETVSFRPFGHSMQPKIYSGQLCTVEPVKMSDVRAGDVVLCSVNGDDYLHNVLDVARGSALIGNNRGNKNGWTKFVFGKLTAVSP